MCWKRRNKVMNLQPLGLSPYSTAVAEHASATRRIAEATAKLDTHTAASAARGVQNAQTLSNLLAMFKR